MDEEDDGLSDYPSPSRRHKAKLREEIWTPRAKREHVCARCGLVKGKVVTLVMAGERFGLCERCLETLWNLAFHDE